MHTCRFSQRTIAAALLLTACLTACGGGGGVTPTDDADAAGPEAAGTVEKAEETATGRDIDPELDAEPATQWDVVAAGIGDDGDVPIDTALLAFSLIVAPLPGVEMPDLPPGDADDSGTMAIWWVQRHWPDLTDEQRATVADVLELERVEPAPVAGDAAVPGAYDGDIAAGPARVAVDGASPDAEVETGDGGCFSERAFYAHGPGTEPYVAVVDRMLPQLATKLGLLGIPVYVKLIDGADSKAHAMAIAQAPGCVGKATSCGILVTARGQAESGRELDMIIAHEIVHCYQGELNIEVMAVAPSWIVEGYAAWAGEEIVDGVRHSKTDAAWDTYLTTPGKTLFSRSYDAIGFFAHVQRNGRDLWDLFPAVMTTKNDDAFFFAVGLDQDPARLLDGWATSFARDEARGTAWDADGPGITDAAYEVPQHVLDNGAGLELNANAVSTDIDEVLLDADFTTIEFSTGAYGRVGLEAGGEKRFDEIMNEGIWCTGAECTCPAGTPNAGRSFPAWPGRSALMAITGAANAATATLSGLSTTEVCGEEEKPKAESTPGEAAVDPCLVGSWVSGDFTEAGPAFNATGGAGVVVRIQDAGNFVIDFGGMEPLVGTEFDLTQQIWVEGSARGRLRTDNGTVRVDGYQRDAQAFLRQVQDGGNHLNDIDMTFEVPVGPDAYFFVGNERYTCSGSSLRLATETPLGTTTVPFRKR